MRKINKLSLFYAFFLLQGCTSLESTPKEEFEIFLDSKVDSDISDVIQNWGQPEKEIVSTKKYDKHYWIFETSQTPSETKSLEYAGNYFCKIVFIIDDNKSIKFWVTEGDRCVAPSEYISLDW